ncbi:MAG: hypothetical protein AB1374_05955 [Bacillota bacterium]
MRPEEVISFIGALHEDTALGPLDKNVGTRVFLSMDSLGECRLSRRAIARSEGLSSKSVRQALAKLCARGWLVTVRVTKQAFTYRPGPQAGAQTGVPGSPVGKNFPQSGVKISPLREEKTGARRIEMRRDQVERIIAAMTELQRLYDAGAATDMAAVTEEQKRLWLIYSEQLQDDIDTLVKHLAGYPESNKRAD